MMWPERETLCKHPKDRYKKERNKMEAYTNDNIMQIRNLDVSYDGKLVLHDISMDIRKNRITAIIGPSGCGKTTFLKTLNGLLQEERGAKMSGRISLEGTEIQQVSLETLRKNVGLVFQTPAPFPFSIYKNLTYAPVYYGIRDKKKLAEIVEEKLKLAGLYEEVSGELHKSALKLSGGQKQRLCIARALTVEPKVLLLDEPCSALDVKASAKIEELLLKLSERYTIVIVTHNLAQAKRVADDVAFFQDGRLVEAKMAKEFWEHPEQEETKEFLQG